MATDLSRTGLSSRMALGGQAGRKPGSNYTRLQFRKETTQMFSHQIAQVVHQDRQREIERQMFFRAAIRGPGSMRSQSAGRSIRRSVGRRIVQIGNAIAAEGSARTARINEPCGSVGEFAARQ